MAGTLEKVKNALGITGDYQDDTLNVYIDEIKDFMLRGGVPSEIIDSDVSAGVIARGVTDLWNYNNGTGKLSEYFFQRVTQLVYALASGKIIAFGAGDYGITFPVNIEGVEISESDKIVFTCGEFTKEFTGATDNRVSITFTESESLALEPGTYSFSLKVKKDGAIITALSNGTVVVY